MGPLAFKGQNKPKSPMSNHFPPSLPSLLPPFATYCGSQGQERAVRLFYPPFEFFFFATLFGVIGTLSILFYRLSQPSVNFAPLEEESSAPDPAIRKRRPTQGPF